MRKQDKNQGKRKKRQSALLEARRLRAQSAEGAGQGSSFVDVKAMAEAGNPQAQSLLGFMDRDGRGTAQDYGQAAFWLQKAADGGSVNAYAALALLCQEGLGVNKDVDRAFALYGQGAAKGDPFAEYGLGLCLEEGLGCSQDDSAAAARYEKACEVHVVQACFKLARATRSSS